MIVIVEQPLAYAFFCHLVSIRKKNTDFSTCGISNKAFFKDFSVVGPMDKRAHVPNRDDVMRHQFYYNFSEYW
jgi:hypothetical protein